MAILDGFVPRKRFRWDKMKKSLRHRYGQNSGIQVLSYRVFLLHSIWLVVIQGKALGLADPLLLLQFDIFLGLLKRDIAGKI